ncbi:MAG: glycosyltransferase family 39 protein [Shinella sp.]|nr:glycosyltransferase family 39 protein [Shinella sp.]
MKAVLGVLACYFLLNVLLRVELPHVLELDEAEQVFFSQWLQLGYSSQPPLYNWMQKAVFFLTGPSLLGLSILKNGLLFLCYVFYALAARTALEDRRLQIVAVLGLLTLPQVSFMAQQDLAHTVGLLAATSLFLYAFFRIVRSADPAAYVLLGAATGLGFLTKYNFVLLPLAALVSILPEKDLRARLFDWRIVATAAIAAAIVLPHALWFLGHLDVATAETLGKMTDGEAQGRIARTLTGLGSLAVAIVAFSALAMVIFAAIFRGETVRVLTAGNRLTRIVERMLLVILLALVVVIVATGTVKIRERWLDPFLLVLPLYLCLKIEAAGAADRILRKGLLAIPAVVLLLVPAILYLRVAATPLIGDYTKINTPSDLFAETVTRDVKPGLVVTDDRLLAGSIRLHLPDVPVLTEDQPGYELPFTTTADRPILLAWSADEEDGEDIPQGLSEFAAGIGITHAATAAQMLELPFHYAMDPQPYRFGYAWVYPPSPAGAPDE